MASAAASVAMADDKSNAEYGSTPTHSTVPAMVVFRPSVGKRVIGLMPDRPAAIALQLSDLPTPRDVTSPMPVTTTTRRPLLSKLALPMACASVHRRDEAEALAAPWAESGDEDSVGTRLARKLVAGAVERRIEDTLGNGQGRERHSDQEVGFE